MKIGYVIRSLEDSGVTVYVLRLADAMRRRGHDVFLVSDGGRYEQDVAALGLRRFALPLCRGPLVSYLAARRLAAIVRDERPDILHANWRRAQLACHLAGRKTGVPFVSTLHLVGIPSGWLYRRLTHWGARVIAPCSEARDYLRDTFAVPESRIRLIYHGVDPARWPPPSAEQRLAARRGFGLDDTAAVMVCVARLEAIKGHELLLRAMAAARRQRPNLKLLLVGDGVLRAELERRAADLGLSEAVRFLGYTEPQTPLAAADLFVLASHRESFGQAPVEAMLMGLPVLRTASAGATDQIVDGQTGRVVPLGDEAALAGAMVDFASADDRWRAMGSSARQRALELFTLDVMAARVEQVYREVVAG
jgi:glycosyltransferase involved in cell wall biosynthesis